MGSAAGGYFVTNPFECACNLRQVGGMDMGGMDMGGMDMGGMDMGMLPSAAAMLRPAPWDGSLDVPAAVDESSDPNVVEVTIRAAPTTVEYLPGKPTPVWAYQGSIPGPLIRAKIGDRIVVHFRNDLPEATTVHWHGLRVPVAMDGAGPATTPIPAGGTFDYDFVALDAGTYWYHSHASASQQVDRGLYGSIIIDDPAAPAIAAAKEKVVVLDDVMVDPVTGERLFTDDMRSNMLGHEGNLALVDGRRSNVGVAVRAGEAWRLRLVNAANARYFRLAFVGMKAYRIGTDDGLLQAPEAITELLLVPGGRADIVVWVDAASTTGILRAVPYVRGEGGATESIDLVRFLASADAALTPPTLPTVLRTIAPLAAPAVTRTIALGEGMSGGKMVFTLNGAAYPAAPILHAAIGTVEKWTFLNATSMDHPLHVHGFSFQPVGTREWRDTINVPSLSSVSVLVDLSAHAGATGHWMYHCHILEHAEGGMMAELAVE